MSRRASAENAGVLVGPASDRKQRWSHSEAMPAFVGDFFVLEAEAAQPARERHHSEVVFAGAPRVRVAVGLLGHWFRQIVHVPGL